MTIQAMLISIQCLMDQPDPGNPQDAVVGSQVLNNPEVFKVLLLPLAPSFISR